MPGRTTRAEDERDLKLLRLKERGFKAADIARMVGLKDTRVRVILGRIDTDYVKSTGGAEDVFGVRRV